MKQRQREENAGGARLERAGTLRGAPTGTIRAEVDGEDVVAEAGDVFQLRQVSLQRAAGQSRFIKRSHKSKHEGVQTGGPAHTHAYANTGGSVDARLKGQSRASLFPRALSNNRCGTAFPKWVTGHQKDTKAPPRTICRRSSLRIPAGRRGDSGTP